MIPSYFQLLSSSSCVNRLFWGTGIFRGMVVVVVEINALAMEISHVLSSRVRIMP